MLYLVQTMFKIQFEATRGSEPRWWSRRMCSHSLLQEHQIHNQLLDNHRQEDTGTHQKRYLMSKDKGEATVRRQEGCNHSKIKSHNCCVGDSQTGQHLYHRSSPTGVKVLSPHQVSQPGGLATGGGIPRESDFEGYWDLTAGLRQDWGKKRLHSWRAHTKQCAHQDPKEGAVTPGKTEPDLPASVEGSPAEAGGGCGTPQGQGLWQQKFWELLLGVSPPRVHH